MIAILQVCLMNILIFYGITSMPACRLAVENRHVYNVTSAGKNELGPLLIGVLQVKFETIQLEAQIYFRSSVLSHQHL